MTRNIVETAVGAAVLAVALGFAYLGYSTAHGTSARGYLVSARFDHIDGTQPGADVRISGIRVGTIASQSLDPKTFQAIVTLRIDPEIKLPTDTVATITSSGLLGDKFLQLVPGAEDDVIAPGGQIKFTQAPVSLESLLGQAVFSFQNQGKQPAGGSSSGGPAPSGPNAAGSAPSPSPTPSAH